MNTRRLLPTLLLIALLAGLAAPVRPARAQTAEAYQIIELVNTLRASLGLTPFQINASLMAAAQSHAEWMAANTSYTHTGAGGSRPQDRAAAAGYGGFVSENIVGGTNLSPQQGVIWWENSSIHYQTMTTTRYVEVGAGYARGGTQNMYVLVVGYRSDYAPAPGASNAGQSQAAESNPAPEQAAAPPVVIPVEVAEAREDGSVVHVVQMGQTAWDIAAAYEIALDDLLWLNALPDDPIILPGDELLIRAGEDAAQTALVHTVRDGETAWSIAARYGLDLAELLALNGLPEDPLLLPGDELVIRPEPGQGPRPTATPQTMHTVQAGQSVWAIAARYGLSVDDLLALNDLGADAVLQPGDVLRIRPDAAPAPTETPTAVAASPTPPPAHPIATDPPAGILAPPYTEVAAIPSPVITITTPTATPAPSSTTTASLPPGVTLAVIVGVGLALAAGVIVIVGTVLERRGKA